MVGKLKIFIKKTLLFLSAVFTLQLTNLSAAHADLDFSNLSFSDLASLFSECIKPPSGDSMQRGDIILSLANSGSWLATGKKVDGGKSLNFSWNAAGINAKPDRYKILYRFDPRFPQRQTFIQKYDYTKGLFISDFHNYREGVLVTYLQNPTQNFDSRIKDFNDYFDFVDRPSIKVSVGDVINISLIDSSSFFSGSDKFLSELQPPPNTLMTLNTSSGIIPDGSILSASADDFCQKVWSRASWINSNSICYPSSSPYSYYEDMGYFTYNFLGKFNSNRFSYLLQAGDSIAQSLLKDKGAGIGFYISGGETVKDTDGALFFSQILNKYILYYEASSSGSLIIQDSFPKGVFYDSQMPYMKDWPSSFATYQIFLSSILGPSFTNGYSYLLFGRSFFEVEIGGSQEISVDQLNSIKLEYKIVPTGGAIPTGADSGNPIAQSAALNADSDGYLYVRVVNEDPNLSGNINLSYSYYTGSTVFSEAVWFLLQPILQSFSDLSKIFFHNLSSDYNLIGIIKVSLVLYVIFFGIYFLIGAVEIKAKDLLSRIVKIAFVSALFTENSWNFFNDYIFVFFVSGINQLMGWVTGVTSSQGNVFGFIDPIFNRYTDPNMWFVLLVELLYLPLTLFVILAVIGMLQYLRAILEVIVGYCMSFLIISVLIALGPFFITLILFERTKSMFYNWISLMFSYTVQPTLLLMFILILEQLIWSQLPYIFTSVCWECVIPIGLSLGLSHLGIDFINRISLPFLDCIPFFVPQIKTATDFTGLLGQDGTLMKISATSLLLFMYFKLAKGLISFLTILLGQLTRVSLSRQGGKFHKTPNPITDIVKDVRKSPAYLRTGIFKGAGAIGGAISWARGRGNKGKTDLEKNPKDQNKGNPIKKDAPGKDGKDPVDPKGQDKK